MPPRRSHKKSRAGCQRCKARKIKCDEVHPRCGNCVRHGVSCDFDGAVPSSSSSNGFSTATPSSSAATEAVPQPSTSNALFAFPTTPRILELKLIHHFSTQTAKSLAPKDSEVVQEVWQVRVPSRAFETPYLLDALLALAALHMRSLADNDAALVRASHGYMASALSQYSSLLAAGVQSDNAEAMFLTGTLIAFQISASRRFVDDLDDPNGYTLPIPWFHAFQGLKALVLASWSWLRDSDCVRPIVSSQPTVMYDDSGEKPRMFDGLLEGMEADLATLPEPLRLTTQQAYEHAVGYLIWAVQREPEQGSILGFPATVTRRFVELVEQRDPRALCITACFFAMTRVCDHVWWLEGVGKREVKGLLKFIPSIWWPRMAWAIRIVDAQGPIDETIWGYSWKKHDDIVAENAGLNSHIDILAAVSALSEASGALD